MPPRIFRTISEIRQIVASAKQENKKVGLVPTMGGLHAGHLACVNKAVNLCDHVIVSIFVNPTQFNKREDLESYPGNEQEDIDALSRTGVQSIFAPSIEEMYPEGFATSIKVTAANNILCDAHRPGHFEGMATVVAKLFLQTGADLACFGEKDFQQLFIVRKLVNDLNIPIEIEPVATVREKDGLALSSRNRRLTKEERQVAPKLNETMRMLADKIKAGAKSSDIIPNAIKVLETENGFGVEYLEMRSSDTLALLDTYNEGARLFAAANLGSVRLIDNITV